MKINRSPYVQNSPELQNEFIVNQLIGKNINTSDWVEVVKVNEADKTVDVTPLVTQLSANNEAIDHAIIHDISYFRYQSSKAAVIITPSIGDKGLCVYAQNDVTGVKSAKKKAPPTSRRTFDYSDGCFIGLIATMADEPICFIEINDDKIYMENINSKVTINSSDIELTTPNLKINANTEFNGNTKFNGNTDTIGAVSILGTITNNNVNIGNTHAHIGVQTGSGISGVVTI